MLFDVIYHDFFTELIKYLFHSHDRHIDIVHLSRACKYAHRVINQYVKSMLALSLYRFPSRHVINDVVQKRQFYIINMWSQTKEPWLFIFPTLCKNLSVSDILLPCYDIIYYFINKFYHIIDSQEHLTDENRIMTMKIALEKAVESGNFNLVDNLFQQCSENIKSYFDSSSTLMYFYAKYGHFDKAVKCIGDDFDPDNFRHYSKFCELLFGLAEYGDIELIHLLDDMEKFKQIIEKATQANIYSLINAFIKHGHIELLKKTIEIPNLYIPQIPLYSLIQVSHNVATAKCVVTYFKSYNSDQKTKYIQFLDIIELCENDAPLDPTLLINDDDEFNDAFIYYLRKMIHKHSPKVLSILEYFYNNGSSKIKSAINDVHIIASVACVSENNEVAMWFHSKGIYCCYYTFENNHENEIPYFCIRRKYIAAIKN